MLPCPRAVHKSRGITLTNHLNDVKNTDLLCMKASNGTCRGSMKLKIISVDIPINSLLEESIDFTNKFFESYNNDKEKQIQRLNEVANLINTTGTYELTKDELDFGAKTAWRNASRCIGRIQWKNLDLFDKRHVASTTECFEHICHHLKHSYNEGNIQSAITIFNQSGYRILNPSIYSYAAYYTTNPNTIIGDKKNLDLTNFCIELGWKEAAYTEFDVLPLIIQKKDTTPEFFNIPKYLVYEVQFTHPHFNYFGDLQLKWFAIPFISNMSLDIGGMSFATCPFNGWFMSTEIARNLSEANRYNKLEMIARIMGLDPSSCELWQDKAFLELNISILYSFKKAGVKIVDHHRAAESFMTHYQNEVRLRGGCPADWVWIVPAMSGSLTPVFHQEMLDYHLKPSYEYQKDMLKEWRMKSGRKNQISFKIFVRAIMGWLKLKSIVYSRQRVKCTITYATEFGTSLKFARILYQNLLGLSLDVKWMSMDTYNVTEMYKDNFLIVITSTYGNGMQPENGTAFKNKLNNMLNSGELKNVKFSVFGLGHSMYTEFCGFAKFCDNRLTELGASRFFPLTCGDEKFDQRSAFDKWLANIIKNFHQNHNIKRIATHHLPATTKQFMPVTKRTGHFNLVENLKQLHGSYSNILASRLVKASNLEDVDTGQVTLLVELEIMSEKSSEKKEYYRPGDKLEVFSANKAETVDAILSRIEFGALSVEQTFAWRYSSGKDRFGDQIWMEDKYLRFTMKEALTYYYDISRPLGQKDVFNLSTQSKDPTESEELMRIGQLNEGQTLNYFLVKFRNLRPTCQFICLTLPILKARIYSLSSSPWFNSKRAALTVGVRKSKWKNGDWGICSKWMENLQINDLVPVCFRKAANFQLPIKKSVPIILVANGTGIAPFRSFWEEKASDLNEYTVNGVEFTPSDIYLFFGCRSRKSEFHRVEIQNMIDIKIITKYYPAYSQEPNMKKTYVQDLFYANKLEVFDVLFKQDGELFVCGSKEMNESIIKGLKVILCEAGDLDLDDASKYMDEMKGSLRIHEEIFFN